MKCSMRNAVRMLALIVALAALGGAMAVAPAAAQETPRPGGELAYSVLAEPPSFDAHQEATFAVPHSTAPFYSLLVKFDPFEYPKIVPDLAESWTIAPDGKTYEFKLRSGVKFHDGSALTSRDVKASLDHVVFPPTGVVSPRRAVYRQVDGDRGPEPEHRAGAAEAGLAGHAHVPGLAVELHLQGRAPREGPALVQEERHGHRARSSSSSTCPARTSSARRTRDYFVKGLPYLDSFRALYIPDAAARVAALRGGRVAADFVGATPPWTRPDLKQAMGDKVVVQESNWTCVLTIAFNHEKKPFDDPRVRRALSLALDRREAARVLHEFSEYGTVAGISQPGAPYAMPPTRSWRRSPGTGRTSRRAGRRRGSSSRRRGSRTTSRSRSATARSPSPSGSASS